MPAITTTEPTTDLKANGKPAKAPPKKAPVKPTITETREMLYPTFETIHCFAGSKEGPITMTKMKALLGWETEEDHVKRRMAADGGKEKQYLFGDDFLLLDTTGRKVQCWNNVANRPFDLQLCLKYKQDHLSRAWAGPTNFPGETVNGEVIILGKHGDARSLQHRGTAFVLACEQWHAEGPEGYWHKLWSTEPVMDAVINAGVSNDPRIVCTIDCGKARSQSDVIYTETTFAKDGKHDRDQASKKELSRMMAAATDVLRKRTLATNDHLAYATPSTLMNFRENHPKLKAAVLHLYEENKEQAISNLGLSPGAAAALCYLMGCSATEPEAYRTSDPRTEKSLDWSRWNDAQDFWQMIANRNPLLKAMFEVKRPELGDVNQRSGAIFSAKNKPTNAKLFEKLATVAKMWSIHVTRPEKMDPKTEAEWYKKHLTAKDIALTYDDERGDDEAVLALWLDELVTVGGIDLGDNPKELLKEMTEAEAEPEQEEVSLTKEQIKEEKAKAMLDKVKKDRPQEDDSIPTPATSPSKGIKAQLAELEKAHPDKVLIFRQRDSKVYFALADHAKIIAKLTSGVTKPGTEGLPSFSFPSEHYDRIKGKLFAAKHKVGRVEEIKGKPTVFNEVK